MPGVSFPDDEFQLLVVEVENRLDPTGLSALCMLCRRPVHTLTVEALWRPVVVAVLRHAESDLWLGELLETIIASPATYGGPLIAACTHALAVWRKVLAEVALYAPHDPKSALMLFNDAPFVDRVTQRQQVHGLVQRLGRRVMIVRGDPATGKTHTGLFGRHLVEQNPNVQMAPIRLHEMGGELIGPIDLMTEIADRMGFAVQRDQWDSLAQEARQAEKLTRWFEVQTASLRARSQNWLLVIDSLNHPRVGGGALELVDRLIISGSRGDLVNTCLLLLALPTPVPAQVANDVLDITLPPLTETDFRAHVIALAGLMGRNLAEAGASAVVEFLLKGLSFPLGHEGMDVAGQRLRQLPGLIERV